MISYPGLFAFDALNYGMQLILARNGGCKKQEYSA